ncbi:hypothetical protein ACHAPT_000184 [Fusarium lateritium]
MAGNDAIAKYTAEEAARLAMTFEDPFHIHPGLFDNVAKTEEEKPKIKNALRIYDRTQTSGRMTREVREQFYHGFCNEDWAKPSKNASSHRWYQMLVGYGKHPQQLHFAKWVAMNAMWPGQPMLKGLTKAMANHWGVTDFKPDQFPANYHPEEQMDKYLGNNTSKPSDTAPETSSEPHGSGSSSNPPGGQLIRQSDARFQAQDPIDNEDKKLLQLDKKHSHCHGATTPRELGSDIEQLPFTERPKLIPSKAIKRSEISRQHGKEAYRQRAAASEEPGLEEVNIRHTNLAHH